MNTGTKEKTAFQSKVQPKRVFKDTLFRMIFREPSELLELCNALNGTNYTNPDDLHIITLENAIYMNYKNDLAFVLGCQLNLYEHQSTINPNMPLRNLVYVVKEYEGLLIQKSMYSTCMVKIPTPKFIVFYNGTAEAPERMVQRLSDAFQLKDSDPSLEVKVTQLNINAGKNKELMDKCKTLKEYALYVECVRKYAKKMSLAEAVENAVRECIEQDILKSFLIKYKAEAVSMSIFEYNEEKEMALLRQAERQGGFEEGRAEGRTEGRTEGRVWAVIELLESLGELPESIKERIFAEKNAEILGAWLQATRKAESIEDWMKAVGWK